MPEVFDPGNPNPDAMTPMEALTRAMEALEDIAENTQILADIFGRAEDVLVEFPDDKPLNARKFLAAYREKVAEDEADEGEEEEGEDTD